MRKTEKLNREEIVRLHDALPKVTEQERAWLTDAFEGIYAVYGKKASEKRNEICYCTHCGGAFRKSDASLRVVEGNGYYAPRHFGICPHCGRTIRFETNGNTTDYVALLQDAGENHKWGVTRIFRVRKSFLTKQQEKWENVTEVEQFWEERATEKKYLYRQKRGRLFGSEWWERFADTPNGWKFMKYDPVDADYGKPFVCNDGAQDMWMREKYDAGKPLDTRALRYIDISDQHGVDYLTILDAMKSKNAPYFETLWKAGKYKFFSHFAVGRYEYDDIKRYWSAIKICIRNGYEPKDVQMWRDMVQLMLNNNVDTHNAFYVCPKDLRQMHDMALRKDKKRRDEEKLKTLNQQDKELQKRVQRFLDMDIHGKNLHIIVLPTIRDFKDEGDHLGHCVYRCGYYNRVNSLILSARDESGKRWETIEVSLIDLKVLQCYGYGDRYTERHQEILNLVNSNMWQIKERRDGKKLRRAS